MRSVRDEAELRAAVGRFRRADERVALVPTMGALHEGHLSLMRRARQATDRVVASIYVNPTQFAPGEDLESYPRDVDADLAKLAGENVDLVYLPDTLYASDHTTSVVVGGVGEGLETDHRPTFFHGVALVVCKLLNRVRPDIAVFGEKDYQQLAVIRRMVRDLDMNVDIIGAPIARDAHGLALSSRNRYFDAQGLDIARQFNAVLRACVEAVEAGEPVPASLRRAADALRAAGFTRVDYVSLADARSLARLDALGEAPARLLSAAHCPAPGGDVRLIDNMAVGL